nr:ABC transporter ATP-binding protein [Nitrosomonas nitrosa]
MDKHDAARSGRLAIGNVSKLYGQSQALAGINLTVENGEFVSLLGPSGCGKTTLLRCVAGLVTPNTGTIEVDGHRLDGVPPWKRDISVVFQSYALFPHMSVAGNVAFGLKMRGIDRKAAAQHVIEALDMVGMTDFASRLPAQLSGGQQQRVALARAIVVRPRILLLDEPMAALDAKLRTSVQREIRQLQLKLGITTILVTHDQSEAMAMSDRIAVMRSGIIEQIADPQALYDNPATPFVAEFVGDINRMHGRLLRGGGDVCFTPDDNGEIRLPISSAPELDATEAVTLMVRPENLRISNSADPHLPGAFHAIVDDRVLSGDRIMLYLRAGNLSLQSVVMNSGDTRGANVQVGQAVLVNCDCNAMIIFPD